MHLSSQYRSPHQSFRILGLDPQYVQNDHIRDKKEVEVKWSFGTFSSGNLPVLVITDNLQNVTMLQPIVNISWSCGVGSDTEA